MPSGNSHTLINLSAAVIGLSVAAYYGYLEPGIYGAAGLVVSDLFLSPDLDNYYSNAKRRWWILKWIWKPYEGFAHRSPFTHWPILADMIRMAYLATVAAGLLFVYHTIKAGAPEAAKCVLDAGLYAYNLIAGNQTIAFSLFGGQCAATFLHGFADWITKEGEKRED